MRHSDRRSETEGARSARLEGGGSGGGEAGDPEEQDGEPDEGVGVGPEGEGLCLVVRGDEASACLGEDGGQAVEGEAGEDCLGGIAAAVAGRGGGRDAARERGRGRLGGRADGGALPGDEGDGAKGKEEEAGEEDAAIGGGG